MKRLTLIIALWLCPSLVHAAGVRYGATLDSLRWHVRDVLGEVNKVRFPDSVLTTFINEGQIRVAIDCGAYRKKDTIVTDTSKAFYAANSDAIEGWPIDVICHNPALSPKSRWWGLRWLLPKDWVTSTDEDKPMFFSGYVASGEYVVYPASSDSGWSMFVYYRALPPALDDDSVTTSSIPETDRPGIVSFAAKRAAESVGWDVMAAAQWEQYQWHVDHRLLDMVAPRYDIKGKDQSGTVIQ